MNARCPINTYHFRSYNPPKFLAGILLTRLAPVPVGLAYSVVLHNPLSSYGIPLSSPPEDIVTNL
jgi:hypothetical protein